MISWLKTYALYICLAVIVLLLLICGVEGYWIKRQAARIEVLDSLAALCKTTNDANKQTIDLMKADIAASTRLCGQRLQAKDSLLRKLQDIDSLQEDDHASKLSALVPAADPLLAALNRMYPAQDDRADGVLEAGASAGADGTDLVPGQLASGEPRYCLDALNARNLLKNHELNKSDRADLRAILEGVK